MRGKIKSLKRLVPKKIQTRRFAYLGMAILILFSIISYSLFFNTPQAKAATIGTSSSASGTGNENQKHMVVTSKGILVSFYNAGSTSPTGIVYATSSDNGSTWGSPTQVDSTQTDDFSVAIDHSDNINLAFASSGTAISYRSMTYSSGSWSIGSSSTLLTSSGCCGDSPVIAVNADNEIEIIARMCNASSSSEMDNTRSTNGGSSWTTGTPINAGPGCSSAKRPALVGDGKTFWALYYAGSSYPALYADLSGTGTWSFAGQATLCAFQDIGMIYGLDKLHFVCTGNNNFISYYSYDIASGAFSAATTISASGNDVNGNIATDSNYIWIVYSQFVGTNSYNIVYKSYNGTTWDTNPTSLTTNNLNNLKVNTPGRVAGSVNVPVMWTEGTGSPYNIKSTTLSTAGTVTDTGNQTGSYSGTLTGSSGDIIVKCGVWYYNTVNIVSGMTIKVCASDGQTGGNLTIYANSVTVAGSINGSGRGSPGGVGIFGAGGAAGGLGSSFAGVKGAGANAGSAGTAGTNGTPAGTAGTTSSAGANNSPGGTGGTGGNGTTSTTGGDASLGGYLSAGTNSDSSTDESLTFGSGGGSGGSGGSGAGGGNGGNGQVSTNVTTPVPPGYYSAGGGGAGGAGGSGGAGGKGGNGGAYIRIYSQGAVSISGSIVATGQAASASRVAPLAAQAGTVGGQGTYCSGAAC